MQECAMHSNHPFITEIKLECHNFHKYFLQRTQFYFETRRKKPALQLVVEQPELKT